MVPSNHSRGKGGWVGAWCVVHVCYFFTWRFTGGKKIPIRAFGSGSRILQLSAESMCHRRKMSIKGTSHGMVGQSCGLCVSILYCVCLWTHRWRSANNFMTSVLFTLIYVCSRGLTQLPRLSEQALYLLSHLTGSIFCNLKQSLRWLNLLSAWAVYNSNTQEAEGSWIQDRPSLHGKTISKQNKKSTKRNTLIPIFKNIFNVFTCVPCACRKPQKSEGVIGTLGTGVIDGCKFPSKS